MSAGLFINNELLTLVTTGEHGKLQFSGLNTDSEVYLFFRFDKTHKPPVKPDQDARYFYYPEHPDILGDILKFTDSKNDRYKIFNKKFNRFDVLNTIIQKVLSENIDHLAEKNGDSDASPFFLIVPSYISEKLKNKLAKSIREKIKSVNIINYEIPYINSLLAENRLPEKGNVLYVEMSFTDIYFKLMKTSFKNGNYEVNIEEEDKISDTKLVFRTIRMVAEELAELAFNEYGFAGNNDKLIKENEIQHLIPDAQDILMELSTVDEWNSIEVEVELSDGSAGPVLILKNKLIEKFAEIVESEGLESKIDRLLKKYKPASIVLFGENLNNPFLLNFFKSYQECRKIKHQDDYYTRICNTVFEKTGKTDKKSIPGDEALEVIKAESIEQQIVPADVIEVEPYSETKKTSKGKGVLIKILIPVLIAIAAILIYKYIPILSYKVKPETIEFGAKAGEIQLLKIQSSGKWQINDVPGWLKMEKLTDTGTEEILVWTAGDNKTNNSKTAVIHVDFGHNVSKPVQIVQHGISDKTGAKTGITPMENDTVSTLYKKSQPDKWSYIDLNTYIEGIRESSEKIDFGELFKHVDPNCEVYYYINEEKLPGEDITTFINKIKLGGIEKLKPNSLKYDSQGKIIEFGQE